MRAGYKRLLRSDSGNALVLAMLLILALTSVGVVSVQRTNTDLMVAGNISRSTQAFLGSDAGMQHALALVGNNTQGYLEAVTHERVLGGSNTNNDMTYAIVSATTAAVAMPNPVPVLVPGDTATENLWLSAVDSGNTTARMQQDVAYSVAATWVSEEAGLSGNSKDANICYEVYDFNAQGGIPTRIEAVTQTMAQTDTVVVLSRARAMTGPTRCMFTHY